MNIPPDVIDAMQHAYDKADCGLTDAESPMLAALSVLADSGWVVVPKEPTEATLRAACEAAGWWAEPYTAPRECGVPIECDMSQEDADIINKDGMEAMREQYKAMLAAFSPDSPPADGWLPIETAPQDGSEIDIWCVNNATQFRAPNSVFLEGKWIRWLGWSRVEINGRATHWRPLPLSPIPTKDTSHDG